MDKFIDMLKNLISNLKDYFKNTIYKFKYNINKRNTLGIMYKNIINEKRKEISPLEEELKLLKSQNILKKDEIEHLKYEIEKKTKLLKNIQELIAKP
ncbi:hypothetical protein KQI89_05130 [Clostridium sp. MSJ-4]|uniref:Uncharacterized protein n=1 Tax=Clostridium simiarum TaxID=2841506 RepID=A0ABS6EZK2_9CLOT|nr:hypothetical protein [Clostridium simiarum]MBU5591140.1 hypothetical protein [Clostridium simiarum]